MHFWVLWLHLVMSGILVIICIVDKQMSNFTKFVNRVTDIQVGCSAEKTQWLPLCSIMRLDDGADGRG